MRTSRGSLFIVALWSLCFLGALAVVVAGVVRQKMTLSSRLDARAQLRQTARAAVELGLFRIAERAGGTGYFSGRDPLLQAHPEVPCRWSISDEESRVNLNTADMFVLRRLMQEVLRVDEMQAQELAAAVVDWRDADSELSVPIGSAEEAQYLSQQYPYKPKNAPFESWVELGLVKGFTDEFVEALFPYVTVFGMGKVNANTAPAPVLRALGIPEELVEAILEYRRGQDDAEGTADDNVFEAEGSIVPKLSQYRRLNDQELAELTRAGVFLGVASEYFRIQAQARRNVKETYEMYAVADAAGTPVYWREP
jgi:general secretion pathway protein K